MRFLRLILIPVFLLGASFESAIAAPDEIPIDITHLAEPSPTEIIQHQKFVRDMTDLGRRIFNDKTLSASGRMSCASCHEQSHSFNSPNHLAVQLGGKDMKLAGTRAVPSLSYIQNTPPFNEHYIEDEGAHPGEDVGPTGGFTWDGRADTLHQQASIPFFSKNEMANTPELLAKRLSQTSYSTEFVRLFGNDFFKDQDQVLERALMALEIFQQSPNEFYPYTSKYDAVLRGKAQFTKQEARGFSSFTATDKGNCASCHPAAISAKGAFPQFTDYGYAALGLPRNMKIPANANPEYFDLGLCGPSRADLVAHKEYCGLFKVPSLRNVARKKVFYHNGIASSLEQAVRFYVERDSKPEKWYPTDKHGHIRKFNDMPEAYQTNIEVSMPFGPIKHGRPRMTEQDIKDIVAFLKTLNDGYESNSQGPVTNQ